MKNTYSDCFLLIPTRNRTSFLEAALMFYSLYSNRPKIIIADSSNDDYLQANKLLIKKYSSDMDISHQIYNFNISFVDKILKAASFADEFEYMGLVADDDYLSLGMGSRCLSFLRESVDHAFVTGITVTVDNAELSPVNPRKSTFSTSILSDSPLKRVDLYSGCKRHRMYGFHRKSILIEAFEDALLVDRREIDIFTEYFIYLSIMLRGKFLCINEVGLVFLDHGGNASNNYEALDLPVQEQSTYEEQLDVSSKLLAKWLCSNDLSYSHLGAQLELKKIIKHLFEVKRSDEKRQRVMNWKYKILKIILFPVTAIYISLDKLGVRQRAIINSRDEWFNFRMQASNSSFRQIFSNIIEINRNG